MDAIKSFGTRLQLVGLVPTYMALGALLLLLVADAPASRFTWETLGSAAREIGGSGALLLLLASFAVSITLQPLQFRLVQLLEGYWPDRGPQWLRKRFLAGQVRRRNRLVDQLAEASQSESGRPDVDALERMQSAEQALRERFPDESRLMPTSLGNALRAAEDRAGPRYGLESVIIWPRLYPLLPEPLAQDIEDEVTQLDVSTRLAVTWTAAGLLGTGVLLGSAEDLLVNPAWLLIVVALMLLGRLSYRSAVESAIAHGYDIEVALDLHRSQVIEAMRLTPPGRLSHERRLFAQLCQLFQTYTDDPGLDLEYRRPR